MNAFLHRNCRLLTLGAFVALCSIACAMERFTGIALLQSRFPGSITLESKATDSSFQFCPDNTCDLIKAKKPISTDELAEVGYAYIYYFSDYTELTEWRKGQLESSAADQVLNRNIYSACSDKTNRARAVCVLQLARKRFELSLYFVRYDENERHQEKSAFSTS